MRQVKWVEQGDLLDTLDRNEFSGVRQNSMIPVIPLSALTEVVEGLKDLIIELQAPDGIPVKESLHEAWWDDPTEEDFCTWVAQRLLAQLDGHTKE